MKKLLEIKNLKKSFGKIAAVDGISFVVEKGCCFGLLGPNGAGKTTSIEMIEGITAPSSGEILYKGAALGRRFKEEIGIQFQNTQLLDFLTVKETLETFANLYAFPVSLEDLAKRCQLEDIMERRNNRISGGQKQRLLLALALLNDPELIFLDEPTTGLDPQARHHTWEIVETIKKAGKTLILTTHYMEEAQILCDEIAIMDKGKIIARGAPDTLVKALSEELTISIPSNCFTKPPDQLFSAPDQKKILGNFFQNHQRYEFHTSYVTEAFQLFLDKKVDLNQVWVRKKNLEDLFLEMTGRRLRE